MWPPHLRAASGALRRTTEEALRHLELQHDPALEEVIASLHELRRHTAARKPAAVIPLFGGSRRR